MSKIQFIPNASGTGTFNIVSPNSNSDFTLTLPESSGTILFQDGTIPFDAGSVSTPSITTTGDLNTGIWFPAADTMAASTGGTERMRIDSSGNVGIGTGSPSVALDVAGSVRASQSLTIGTGGNYQAGSIYSDSNWGIIFRARQASPGQAEFRWANSVDTELMRINSSGNVGIGTTSPAEKLHVAGVIQASSAITLNDTNPHALYSVGPSQIGVRFNNGATATGYMWLKNFASSVNGIGVSSGALAFATTSTERMRIDSSGNVGIGTSSPTYKTEINSGSLGTSLNDRLDTLKLKTSTSNADELNFYKIRQAAGSGWDTAAWRIQQRIDVTDQAYIQFNGSGLNYGVAFGTNNTERMRIDINGNVGIGITSTISNPLHVKGGDSTLSTIIIDDTATGGGRKWGLRPGLAGVSNGYFAIYDETAAAARLTITDSGTVNVPGTLTATTFGTSSQNAYGARTISTSDPTGGIDGDIWYKY